MEAGRIKLHPITKLARSPTKAVVVPLKISFNKILQNSIMTPATLVIFAVAPLNILKGGSVSLVTMLVYKKLSPILKEGHKTAAVGKAVESEI